MISVVLDWWILSLKKLFRKRTRFIRSLPSLNLLSCRCDGSHEHQHLESSVTVDGVAIRRSKTASAYPAALCLRIADLVFEAQPASVEVRCGRIMAFFFF